MHRLIQSLARLTALAGGFVLIVLIVLTSLSIIGRSVNKLLHNDFFQQKMTGFSQALLDLGIGEINGSYELLEAGVAFSIFSFLPLCQLYGSHATVDVFTAALPLRANRWIAAFWEIVLALVLHADHLAALRRHAAVHGQRRDNIVPAISGLVGLCGQLCCWCRDLHCRGLLRGDAPFGGCAKPQHSAVRAWGTLK